MSLAEFSIVFALYSQMAVDAQIEWPEIDLPPIQQTGVASWYGDGAWHGEITANGEDFDPTQFTCAHRSLPFDTMVLVENRSNGRKVWCRINDRGPYGFTTEDGGWDFVVSNSPDKDWRGILDMSIATAEALGTIDKGMQSVHLRYWARPRRGSFHLTVLSP